MDNLLRWPGTNFRFGLDPLLGLLLGICDTTSSIISAFGLIQARSEWIPGIGDAFSFWFKSNARNYQILQAYLAEPKRTRRSDWIFVIAILLLLSLIVSAGLLVSFFLLQQIL